MSYTTWKFSNLNNRFLLDFYAWTISVWKHFHLWSFEWHSKTWFQIGPFEFMYHPQPQVRQKTDKQMDVECKHMRVRVESRRIAIATLEEPEEHEFRASCRDCGAVLELGEIPDGAEEKEEEWEPEYYEGDL